MALTREHKIVGGLVVLAALSGLVYVQIKKDSMIGTPQAAAVNMPAIGTSEEIDKISIKNGEKPEVVLEKKGDKWAVTQPLSVPANQANVKSLLDNLKEIKAKEVVSLAGDEGLKKQYDLDGTKVLHLTAWKGADKKVDNYFGKSGGRGEMMMTADRPEIFAASGYSSYLYSRELKNWRDTEILKFDDANVAQMIIENKNGTLSFTKGEKWAATSRGNAIDKFDEEKVKDALRSFKSLNAEDFGDGKTPAETGLDKPEATVAITLKDNAGKYMLHVGKVSTGTSHYAQKEGDPTIFVIGSWIADWATASDAKFQKTEKPAATGTAKADSAKPHGH